jgi:Protein of unknown function (DUF4238)
VPEYPNVKNAHIVPRTYLLSWAVAGKIGVRQVHEQRRLVLSVENVGTRRRFYRRKRPDGSEIDDVEWSLGEGEKAAAPVLRALDHNWPLVRDHKAALAELFAVQLLRGTRWKADYEELTRRFLERYPDDPKTPPQLREREEAAFLSDSHRLIQMLSTTRKLATALGSMHWTLLEFGAPLVATSDHPVVLWPAIDSRMPEPTSIRFGVFECGEVRLPLSPTRAVLMTWTDTPDDERTRVQCTRDHAANLNAFTVASADRQWFHLPDTSPPVASGKLLPLAPVLIPSYGREWITGSMRKAAVEADVKAKVDSQIDEDEITYFTVTRPK